MSNQGFASLSKERLLEVTAKGGRTAHALKHAHQFTPEEARRASRLSVIARQKKAQERKGVDGLVKHSQDELL